MADFTLKVGEELKIVDVIFDADNQPGAAYKDTVDAIWINSADSVVQVMHTGNLNGTLKGIAAGTSFLTVTVQDVDGNPLVATSNITVQDVPPPPPPVRKGVRAELMLDQ